MLYGGAGRRPWRLLTLFLQKVRVVQCYNGFSYVDTAYNWFCRVRFADSNVAVFEKPLDAAPALLGAQGRYDLKSVVSAESTRFRDITYD